jgi:hypothetical protein
LIASTLAPGGESGKPAGPYFGNQLGLTLTNDYPAAPLRIRGGDEEDD